MNEGQLIIKYVKSEGMVHNLKRDNKKLQSKLESLEKQLRLDNVNKPFYCSINKSFSDCTFHSDNVDGCYGCNHFEQ